MNFVSFAISFVAVLIFVKVINNIARVHSEMQYERDAQADRMRIARENEELLTTQFLMNRFREYEIQHHLWSITTIRDLTGRQKLRQSKVDWKQEGF